MTPRATAGAVAALPVTQGQFTLLLDAVGGSRFTGFEESESPIPGYRAGIGERKESLDAGLVGPSYRF